MAKKLLEKAGLIHLPPAPARSPLPDSPTDADGSKAKTAPGSMLQFMTAQSAAVKEAETLRDRLANYDGALPARRLDPATVRVSAWANRHADSYQDAAFLALKADIAAAGGNVQPIKVRPLRGAAAAVAAAEQGVGPSNPPSGPVQAARFEIVFGHRRHRACLELGLPVLAVVEELAEQQLFEQMERENRARADLSAWEQGMMYARALDQGLYPSNRQLAQAIGRDLGDVGKALSLARLPAAVVQAFRSPLDLQYRWAKPLADAQQRDPDGLVARARALKAQAAQRSPKQVFDALVGDAGPMRASAVPDIGIRVGGRQVAVVCSDERGHTLVRFAKGLAAEQRRGLAAAVEAFLADAACKG
ncbi:MAG: ParB/RepB/Spo0J family partition protein [Pseudomonadota bacterium]